MDALALLKKDHQTVEKLFARFEKKPSKEIADRMTVSPNTVKAFLRLVMIKMGVSSRSAIMAKIITAKLIS